MSKYGIIGRGISESLSPAMFEASYGSASDGAALYDIIDTETFEEAFERFLKDYDGVNVTMPYKVEACRKADFRDESARIVGAANVLVKGSHGVEAYNTDFDAVRMILSEKKVEGKVLVIGFGGAGKAASRAAATLCEKVFVANRTVSKVVEYFNGEEGFEALSLDEIPSVLPQVSCIIYTLPLYHPCIENFSVLKKGVIIIEANYMHPNIPQSENYAYIGGLKWLLYQALRGFALLTGTSPSIDKISNSLKF